MVAMMKDKPATKDEACRGLTRMVGKVAARWTRNHKQDYYDFLQEGYIGVCEAYDRFDGSKGAAFSSYAYLWVRHYIRQHALKSWKNKNNTASMSYEDYNLGTVSYDNIDTLSIERQINKMDKELQTIFSLRKEGYTFQEVADELGYDSLHKVRNKYMEAVNVLEE